MITYALTATNAGPATATNVVLSDIIPAGLTFLPASSDSHCIQNGVEVLCNNFSLNTGESRTFAVAFTVTAGAACNSTLSNSATVSTSSTDPNPVNNHSNVITTTVNCPVPQADLSISKSANKWNVQPNEPVTYTLYISNSGPNAAQNVIVSDSLPAGLTFDVQFIRSDGFSCWRQQSDANHLVCTISSMAAGTSAAIQFQASVSSAGSCTPRSLLNTASVDAAGSNDPNGANNASQATTQLTCPAPQADLSITKTGSSTVNQGGTVNYTLTATNAGPGTATNVVIADVVPSGLTFNSGASDASCRLNGGSVLCDNFSLTAGQSKTVTVAFTVSSAAACNSTIQNAATVSASSTDPNSSNNQSQTVTTTVVCPVQTADVRISKTGPCSVNQGGSITYALTAVNDGPGTATNVVVIDPIPSGLTFQPSGSDSHCISNGPEVLCNNFSLNSGEMRTFGLVFNVSASAACNSTIQNSAVISTSSTDPNPTNNVSQTVNSTVICAQQNADLSITKTGPASVARGTTVSYTLTATNAGPNTATNVVIADPVPAGLTFNAGASDSSCILSGLNVLCNNFNLASGASKTVTIAFSTSANATCNSTVQNAASVSASSTDPNSANNQSQTVTTTLTCPVQGADLSVEKAISTVSPVVGGLMQYVVTARNIGPDAATSVVVTDPIPAGLTFSAGNSDSACVQNGANVLCTVSSLAANHLKSFAIAFTITSAVTCNSTVTNTATIASAVTDPSTGNNTSQVVSPVVTCPVQNADVSVTKTGMSSVLRGGIVQYTLTATNAGPNTATNVVIADPVPAGLTFNAANSDANCSLNGTNVLCNNATLASGQSVSYVVAFTVSSTAVCNSVIQNTASVSISSPTDPNTANNQSQAVSTTVTCTSQGADLSITKTGPSSVAQGSTITYTVSVANAGPETTASVVVRDTIPAGLTFTTAGSDSACSQTGSIVRCTTASLTSGQSKSFALVFTVPSSVTCNSTISNNATVASNTTDPVMSNNTSSAVTSTVTCGTQTADLSVTKTTTQSTVAQGGVLSYTVTAMNAGPGTANNVVIADVVPSGLTFNSGASDASCHLNGGSVLCDNFSLTSGQSKAVTIAFTVSSAYTCNASVANTATVSTSSTDPVSSNNTSQTTYTTVTCGGTTPSFSISKTDNRATVNTGEALTYVITVTNTSSVNATNVTVTDYLPANLTYISASDGGTLNGSTITWTIGSLTAGATKTLTAVLMVPTTMTNGTVLTNIAAVNGVVAQDTTTVGSGSETCNLSINVSDSRDPVNTGDSFTYTIEVRNLNSTSTNNVSITQTLDSSVDFLSVSNSGNSDSSNTVRWTGLSLGANSSTTLTTTVRVRSGREGTTIHSYVSGCGTQDSENTRVNGEGGYIDDPVIPPLPPSVNGNLTIDKRADRSEAQPGSIVSYTISIRNSSSTPMGPVTLEDAFNSSEMTVQDAEGGTVNGGNIQWNIGTVGGGATRLVHYRVRLSSSLSHGQTVTNTARIAGTNVSDIEEVHIIKNFPQTGMLGNFFKGQSDNSQYLQPESQKAPAQETASLPLVLMITLAAIGMGSGSLLGKKFFLASLGI
ncbi:MAG: DUF11 domain-containing protein [Candidatus Peribacteraceae bacterium]|nr:DUF11 domain-containing protein [Candidatus Peribacteraceae bacterium]